MDILIDIIIWIIKTAANSSSQRTPPPMSPQESDRQRALAAQLQALQQQAIGAVPKRGTVGPGRSQAVKSINWGASMPPRWVTPAPAATAMPAAIAKVADAPAPTPAPQAMPARPPRVPLQVPLIMGEILGPPLALRDPEF